MSDIRKELKLVAKLDTSEIQQQLDALRKMGKDGKVSSGATAANSDVSIEVGNFKKAFEGLASTLNDLNKEFQKVLGASRGGTVAAPGVQPGVNDKQSSDQKVAKEIFDAQRGVYKKLRDGEFLDLDSGKKFKNKNDFEAFKEAKEEKQRNKARDLDEKSQQKMLKMEDSALEKKTKAEIEAVKKVAGEKLNAEMDIAKEVAAFNERAAKDAYQRHPALPDEEKPGRRGLSPMVKGTLGAAGAVGSAGLGILQLQRMFAEFSNRQALDIMSGQDLEGALRQKGRSGLLGKTSGALAGVAGGAATGALAGSFLGPAGTIIGGAIGGIGGGIAGYFGGSKLQGELEVDRAATALQAFEQAKGLIPGRLNALRGGGIGLENLTNLQGQGVFQGFSPEQTIQQFTQARSSLGNRGAARNLNLLQRLSNQVGMDVGTSARGIEQIQGAGGISQSRSTTQLVDSLKKAVSLGFDASRVKDLIQTSNDYLEEQTGLAKIDTQTISDRIATLARGFAGEGDLTATSIAQARRLAEIERGESASNTGLTGIGNFVGVNRIASDMGLNIGGATLSNLAGLSNAATEEDILATLNTQKDIGGTAAARAEAARRIKALKQDTRGFAEKLTGIDPEVALMIQKQEQGGFTEDALGVRRAQKIAGGQTLTTQAELPAGRLAGGQEFERTVLEASRDQTTFVEGIKAITVANDQLHKGIGTLIETVGKSVKALDELTSSANRNAEINRQQN